MNRFTFFCCLYLSGLSFAQEIDEDLSTKIYLQVYNTTEFELTLTVKSRYPMRHYVPTRFQKLKPKDTTRTYFAVELEENQTPADVFLLRIHESPKYYGMNDHYYWKCERIEGETYECLHTIENYFTLTDSSVLDTAQYLKEEYENLPVYDNYALDTLADYPGGMLDLVLEARKTINLPDAEFAIYVRFVVDRDGSVSGFELVKSFDGIDENALKKFFESKTFKPAYKDGQYVRSRLTLPISQRL